MMPVPAKSLAVPLHNISTGIKTLIDMLESSAPTSRERALVITKLEEADHWLEALRRKQLAADLAAQQEQPNASV